MPGRIPTATFNKMVKYLEEQCKANGRPMVTTGAIPITSIDKNRDVALNKVNVKGLINEGNTPAKKTWVRPASGTFSTVEDIEGLLMAGTPADIARDTKRYEEAGSQPYRLRSALPLRRLVPARSTCSGKKFCRRCARKTASSRSNGSSRSNLVLNNLASNGLNEFELSGTA